MSNLIRARNRLPFDFEDGLKVSGVDINTMISDATSGNITTASVKEALGITGNTLSGNNTGDETTATIKTKLGISTLSGNNTGDETYSTIIATLNFAPVPNGIGIDQKALDQIKLGNSNSDEGVKITVRTNSDNQNHDAGYIPMSSTPTGTGNGNPGTFTYAGDILASGDVASTSDERVKTNWRELPENYVEQLALVKHGIYDRTDVPGLTQVGVGAGSLQNILPNAVITQDDENKTLAVIYGQAAMVSCVELAIVVTDLKNQIEDLKLQIASLKQNGV